MEIRGILLLGGGALLAEAVQAKIAHIVCGGVHLSPALAALLLKPHGAKKDLPTRLIDRLFGWIFRPFNRFFLRSSNGYQGLVSKTLGRRGAVFVVYLLLLCAAGVMFKVVPGGFIPTQDKLYLIGGVKMPEGTIGSSILKELE